MTRKLIKPGYLPVILLCAGLMTAFQLPAQTAATTAKPKTTTTQKTTTAQQKTTSTQQKTTTTQQEKTTTPQKKTSTSQKKPAQPAARPQPVKKAVEEGTVKIGSQIWASANLNVITFRNGDTIPEADTNEEWVAAGQSGRPAWCYYKNDLKNGPVYGKLYNWFAVNDPRGLAPKGWAIPSAADWAQLAVFLGGPDAAGTKMKSTFRWTEGYSGSNQSGFNGLPGGYRVENGNFLNLGSIGTWWSATEGKSGTAVDHYLGERGSLGRSSNNRQRGESVRCIKKQE